VAIDRIFKGSPTKRKKIINNVSVYTKTILPLYRISLNLIIMKKYIFLFLALIFSSFLARSQENEKIYLPLLGENAPSFTGESTTGVINFPEDYAGSWTILLSHPGDFTPVCSSEILELAAMQYDFEKLGVKLIVLSTDALSSHYQWVQSLETINYKNREPVKIKFPLLADENHDISRKYGMIQPNTSSTKDVRGVFLIDPSGKIRAIFFYPMAVGRNLEEIKRTVIALQTVDGKGVLTPVNWKPGDDVLIKGYTETTANPADKDVYQLIWYMTFMKLH
jgi:peroxiredoxin 2/4